MQDWRKGFGNIKVKDVISDEGGLKDVMWINNIWSGYKLG
jgi:hypothetical protein